MLVASAIVTSAVNFEYDCKTFQQIFVHLIQLFHGSLAIAGFSDSKISEVDGTAS